MTQTISMTSRISGFAMLALAALPFAALAGGAHAATVVKVSDLNLATAQGVAAFHDRAESATLKFCADERSLTARKACRAGVHAEVADKFDAIRQAQLQQAKTLAAR